MTSETSNLHVSKNLSISKTKQDIEKLKTPSRLVWTCCSDALKIGSTVFRRRGTLTSILYSPCKRTRNLRSRLLQLVTCSLLLQLVETCRKPVEKNFDNQLTTSLLTTCNCVILAFS